MMTLLGITEIPNTRDNVHESVFRAHHILDHVLIMVERGDSKETIFEVVEMLRYADIRVNTVKE